MFSRLLAIFAVLVAIVAGPIAMQPDADTLEENADARLIIITPHNQTIRRAFSESFARHMKAKDGRNVYIDWRVPGGTSEVRRMLDSEFAAASERGREGIGIDLFFGGGAYDFDVQADKNQLLPLRIFTDQPELFRDGIVPTSFSGEKYYHPRGLWIGVCLSSFGIVYNKETYARLGIAAAPTRWEDLADPRLAGQIALSDPTKSGSVNKAFEMLVQEQMQLAIAAVPADAPDPTRAKAQAIQQGWMRGLQLIQRIGANARYFTDSSVQIPLDVAQGNAAAGMCIDFYGRTYNEQVRRPDGSSRIEYFTPVGGSSVSVDPVGILRGAPNRELAEEFVHFLLTPEAQRIWNQRPGTPGAPPSALRRLPLRTDVYTPADLAIYSDPTALPYENTGGFVYKPELTESAFNALATIIQAMCLDSHHELKEAWAALIEAGFPPQATAAFSDVSIASYENATGFIRETLKGKRRIEIVEMQKRLGENFRENYRRAISLAREGR
jgi:ABC-type Fe3+ transport system substrate-binding protein